MSDLRLSEVIATLALTRDRLRTKADHADEAIAALRKLLDDGSVPALPAPAPAPARRRRIAAPAPPTAERDRHGHQVHGAARPRTATCRNEACGKEFAVRGAGRVPHYCSDACRTAAGKRIRRAIESRPAAPAQISERRVPLKTRPVDDAEIDNLLARSKRGAA